MKGQTVVIYSFVVLIISETNCLSMNTRLGEIEGVEFPAAVTGKSVQAFYNIPYAKPPIGSLRFRKPEPYGAWNGTLNATVMGPSCMQPFYGIPKEVINKQVSEDCLQLNIFVPFTSSLNTTQSVMIWIHGGGFIAGQATWYDGRDFVQKSDVILVTVNYRLGAFGFFSTGDEACPGNFGLWDQHLAIKWVHENIADYGGDPQSVTIFGESAGGGSVSLQSFYPGNRNLFQRVIPMSGVATSPIFLNGRNNANVFLRALNCSATNSTNGTECARQFSSADVLRASSQGPPMWPVIDGNFVLGSPVEILQNKSSDVFRFFASLDYMVGVMEGDGAVNLQYTIPSSVQTAYNSSLSLGMTSQIFCQFLIPAVMNAFYQGKSDKFGQICNLYKNDTSMLIQGNLAVDFMTDAMFNFPALTSADFHYRWKYNTHIRSSTFVYVISHFHPFQTNGSFPFSFPWMERAVHMIDVIYLFFGSTFFGDNPTEMTFSNNMVQYFANFAKTGNPNGANVPFWPAYDHLERVQDLGSTIQHRSASSMTGNAVFHFWTDTIYRNTITVQTNLGSMMGEEKHVSGAGSVFIFRKIPYAKPPIGHLRFRKPEPFGPWQSPLNATVYGPNCMQPVAALSASSPNRELSEDCLHLNIYVPYKVSSNNTLSVMIWVHGGWFNSGQGIVEDGTFLSLRGNVILVTFNYRLGPFGFFSTNDMASPGNFGLWDQRLVFQWVHDNIASFGGDPNSVTIFGEGSGGGSVSFQSLYPGNKGLFQKVIALSGVATSQIMLQSKDGMNTSASVLLSRTGCSTSNTTQAVNCLRVLSANSLMGAEEFLPIIDGDFIQNKTETILKNKTSDAYRYFTSLDFMVGTLDGDGSSEIALHASPAVLQQHNSTLSGGLKYSFLCDVLADYYTEKWFDNKTKIKEGICFMYKNTSSSAAQSNAIVDFLTDVVYTYPSMRLAQHHIREPGARGTTYMYSMTRVNPLQSTLMPHIAFPWTKRAVYGMDMLYFFSSDDILASLNQTNDMKLGYEMITYLTNFAKTSNPNGRGLPYWPQYDSDHVVQILDIPIATRGNLHQERTKFWLEKVPSILHGTDLPPTSSSTRRSWKYSSYFSSMFLFLIIVK